MTKYQMSISVHAENEHEAKTFYKATKHLGLGAKMVLASAGDTEYWTVDIDSELNGVSIDALREHLDFLENIEKTV